MQETVTYVLTLALFVFPIALLLAALVRIMAIVFRNQSLLLSLPFP